MMTVFRTGRIPLLALVLLWPGLALAASTAHLDAINAAMFGADEAEPAGSADAYSPLIAKTQILLDRSGISPGVIDGLDGENYRKAVRMFKQSNNIGGDDQLDEKTWNALSERAGNGVMTSYTITDEDLSQTYVEAIPEDYAEKAKMQAMAYTSVSEMLAERFHMDEDFLKAVNPGADFNRAGTTVVVADPASEKGEQTVTRIVVDGASGLVTAYDGEGALVAAYPATVGSAETPSPSGTHEVTAVAVDPNYTYNPENFKQGDNDKVLTIPPGPNGPVGSIWIDLSKPTYGIHGTPEPSKIDKSASHGCVRLTNWDAADLAERVSEGTVVEFLATGG